MCRTWVIYLACPQAETDRRDIARHVVTQGSICHGTAEQWAAGGCNNTSNVIVKTLGRKRIRQGDENYAYYAACDCNFCVEPSDIVDRIADGMKALRRGTANAVLRDSRHELNLFFESLHEQSAGRYTSANYIKKPGSMRVLEYLPEHSEGPWLVDGDVECHYKIRKFSSQNG